MPEGTCAEGYHDGGLGSCLLDGVCATHYHDGGDGSCVPNNQCLEGYEDGGDGSCLPLGTCAPGYYVSNHFGACVMNGECYEGYLADESGNCTICAEGYHDGGNDFCFATDQSPYLCVEGYIALDVDLCIPNWAYGQTVTATSEYNDTSYTVANLVDSDTQTFWGPQTANTDPNPTVTIDLGTLRNFDSVYVYGMATQFPEGTQSLQGVCCHRRYRRKLYCCGWWYFAGK